MAPATARANPIDKHDARRRSLADSALRTLGELGYAKSSLREIASNSEFTHGVVHYYFADKIDLIVYCVKQYKETCVTRYDGVVTDSATPDELVESFAAKLRETLADEAPMHRLWYDLRSQSMFEENLRDAVRQIDDTLQDMIWRVLSRYAELLPAEPSVSPKAAYSTFDGLFQQALLSYLRGDTDEALQELTTNVHTMMPLLVRSP